MCLYTLQGTQIEASVWRDLADRYYDLLEEGKACSCPRFVLDLAADLPRQGQPCQPVDCVSTQNQHVRHTALTASSTSYPCCYSCFVILGKEKCVPSQQQSSGYTGSALFRVIALWQISHRSA